ncbi:aquaporin-like protein [Exidia glandulosa HHB12029]|uniref:Aquaporin-like protein n=1 Tax=Exidia glandulosa HHB12029 TaxID=1314781 RepID=A0A165DE15_EXIGL|nr:aquaporin-like protein [Exidia glandulosa HHB12029]
MAALANVPAGEQFIHLSEIAQRPRFLRGWERHRHRKAHWLVECVAEATGVFLYCFAGGGAQAAFIIGNLAASEGAGSLLTVGLGYAMGIVCALVCASATSGGHFNPCITLAQVVFRGFPAKKAPMFIVAQIFGAFVAFGLIYVQYKQLIDEISEVITAKAGAAALDASLFTPTGMAGIFGLYVPPGTKLGYVFVNEFVCDFLLALVIWACIDPTNMFVPPAAAPFIIGMAYAAMIWGYAPVGLSANAARDVGGRLVALSVWGTKASGGTYAAIAALTNIPATLLAAFFYEFFLTDSARALNPAQRQFLDAHRAHHEHIQNGGPVGISPLSKTRSDRASFSKASDEHRVENA